VGAPVTSSSRFGPMKLTCKRDFLSVSPPGDVGRFSRFRCANVLRSICYRRVSITSRRPS
jgi:hypothetical protein